MRPLAVLLCLALALNPLACGGSSGGGGNGGSSDLRLDQDILIPGRFLQVRHESIRSGNELEVTFAGAGGYEVVVTGASTENGLATVSVPPFVDLTTGTYEAGEVEVSIPGVSESRPFRIAAPPRVTGAPTGTAFGMLIADGLEGLSDLRATVGTAALAGGLDVSAYLAEIDAMIDALETLRDEVEDGAIEMVVDGEAVTLGEEEIAILDGLVVGMLLGIEEEIERTTGAGTSSRTLQGSEAETSGEQPISAVKSLQAIKDALPALHAIQSVALGTVGLFGLGVALFPGGQGPGLLAAATALRINIQTTLAIAGIAIATEAALAHYQNQEFTEDRAWNAASSTIKRGFVSAYVTLGGAVEWAGSQLFSVLGVLDDTDGVVDNIRKLACDDEEGSNRVAAVTLEEICDELEGPDPLSVGLTSGPTELEVGQSGTWMVAVEGGTEPYDYLFDWGDGTSDVVSTIAETASASHAFALPGTYPVAISVGDAAGATASVETSVEVEEEPTAGTFEAAFTVSGAPQDLVLTQVAAHTGGRYESGSLLVLDVPSIEAAGGGFLPGGGNLVRLQLVPGAVGVGTFDLALPDEAFEQGLGQGTLLASSSEIRDPSGFAVIFASTGGTVNLTAFGTDPGDRIAGSFAADVEGEREGEGGPDEILSGSVTGTFDLVMGEIVDLD